MKKWILCFLTCFILYCSSSVERDNIEYYEVVKFEIVSKTKTCINTLIMRYKNDAYIYKIDMVDNTGDTITEYFVSDSKKRFITGDSIYLWYGNWLIKK